MRSITRRALGLLALFISSALAACAGGGQAAFDPGPSSMAPTGSVRQSPDANFSKLYVGNTSTTTVYVSTKGKPVQIISKGLYTRGDMAIGPSGELYLGSASAVYVFKNGKLSSTITDGIKGAAALAIDPSGNLYVANHDANTVTVYAPNGTTPTLTLSKEINKPGALALDNKRHLLYVVSTATFGGPIAMYSTSGTFLKYHCCGMGGPDTTLSVGPSGDLCVATTSAIWLYGPNLPSRTRYLATTGYQQSVAFDSSGKLYIGKPGEVRVYTSTLKEVRAIDIGGPGDADALAFDRSGNLYVANATRSIVTVYPPGSGSAMRTIKKGLKGPAALAFGP